MLHHFELPYVPRNMWFQARSLVPFNIPLLLVAFVIIYVSFHKWYNSQKTREARRSAALPAIPKAAKAAILASKDGPYTPVNDWPRPSISSKELLIRNRAVGLNPIDWKCVSYGFGIYSIPWISGRDAAGIVEEVGMDVHDFCKGDRVWVTSTNYRDNRTSTFQEVGVYWIMSFVELTVTDRVPGAVHCGSCFQRR